MVKHLLRTNVGKKSLPMSVKKQFSNHASRHCNYIFKLSHVCFFLSLCSFQYFHNISVLLHLYDILKQHKNTICGVICWMMQQLPDWQFCRFHWSSWPPSDAVLSIQAAPDLPSFPTPQHWPLFLLWSTCKNIKYHMKCPLTSHY